MDKHARFSRSLLGGCGVFALMMLSAPSFAQNIGRSEINVQATVPLELSNSAVDASGETLTNDPTRSAGFLLGYSFAVDKRFRVEADYGASRNSQRFVGEAGLTELQGDMNQFTGEIGFALSTRSSKFLPYVFAGTGVVKFAPTDFTKSTVAGVQSQTEPVFVYGGGLEIGLTQNMGIRTEYRGLLTKSPTYDLPSIGSTDNLNIAEPSVGLYFRF
jgi:outer membrane immunogenic protein